MLVKPKTPEEYSVSKAVQRESKGLYDVRQAEKRAASNAAAASAAEKAKPVAIPKGTAKGHAKSMGGVKACPKYLCM
eukprot:3309214-Pyramimonas_sp.AAC.1